MQEPVAIPDYQAVDLRESVGMWGHNTTEASDKHYMEYPTLDSLDSSSRLYKFNLNLCFGQERVTAEDRDSYNFGAQL